MNFSKWENQYISLTESCPDRILFEKGRAVSEEHRTNLASRVKSAESIRVEVGSGSGSHLLELAVKYPQSLCLGIELRYKRAYRTIEKAEKAGLSNVLVLRMDAIRAIPLLPPGSVDAVYCNFPDPWDRRRWKKHRLLNREFLLSLHRLLKIGGMLSYKTDHGDYFEETRELIDKLDGLEVSAMSRDFSATELWASNISTEFERLFLSQGLPIFFLEARKIAEAAGHPV